MPKQRPMNVYANGELVGIDGYIEVSDEQLADEAETRALEKADDLIDAITNLAQARTFLKRLTARLIKKGVLP